MISGVAGSGSKGSASPNHKDEIVLEQPRRQSDPATSWQSNGMVCTETVDFAMFPSRRDAQDERNLVGSLRSSYPFAKGGLCKKVSLDDDLTSCFGDQMLTNIFASTRRQSRSK